MDNTATRWLPLAGSERPRPASHVHVRQLEKDEVVDFNLIIRCKPDAPPLPTMDDWNDIPMRERKALTSQEYVDKYGALQSEINRVEEFIRLEGLTVLRSHPGRRTVSVQGTAQQVDSLFDIKLQHFIDPRAGNESQTHRGFHGPVHVPFEIADLVTGIFGLDNRRIAHSSGAAGDPANPASPNTGPDIAKLYNFPHLTASDQTIGVIAPQVDKNPGVSAHYDGSDITTYINNLPAGHTTQPIIKDINITIGTTTYKNDKSQVKSITGATINNGTANNAVLELTQDISTAAGIAQGTNINVYFTQDSENGFFEFFSRVLVPDPGDNTPTVVTMSFLINLGDDADGTSLYSGIGQLSQTSSWAHQMNHVLKAIVGRGINVFYAIGDWGSGDWWPLTQNPPSAPDGKLHVSYPGTDPSVTACGGTILGKDSTGKLIENAWSDAYSTTSSFGSSNNNFGSTGGGVSATFPSPGYQSSIGISGATDSGGTTHSGRVVPDVAGHVSYSGFIVNATVSYGFTGTSCVAPLYAGLTALVRSALGMQLVALNTALYELKDVAFNDIQIGDNDPHTSPANVKITIPTYTGTTSDPPFFNAGVGYDACTGLGSIDGTKLLNGMASLLYNSSFYFMVNKGSYGLDEVKSNLVYSNPTPLWLVIEGFTPNAVTAALVNPSVISAVSGITITVGPSQPQIPGQPNTPQRIYFPCSLEFTSIAAQSQSLGGIFPNSQNPPVSLGALLLAPAIRIGSQLLSAAETTLTLSQGADPYFSNFANNGYYYLSQDLRVFTACPGIATQKAPIDGITLNASDSYHYDSKAAYGYIGTLLNHLNNTYASTGSDAFGQFPDQTSALSGDSSVNPTQPDPSDPLSKPPFASYNFAVARVRVSGTPNTVTDANVRVLFRLFATQTSDTDYQPLTYPSTSDADGQPLAPLLGVGNVTIPFFATGNYEANAADYQANVDYSANSINNQPVNIGASGETFAYYGCYLNIYNTNNKITTSSGKQSVQALLPSTHSCLVAQLVYDDAPYPTGSGIVLGPEWSSNFAQRNLQITFSDNPGPPATHLVPQTFDVRPSPPPGKGQLENYPDELIIDWGNTPLGSRARIYWPAVDSKDVLSLAKKLYSTHQLSAPDDNTISCTVQKGITCVPIPTGGTENFAGLFSIQLPSGILSGQTFTITVRRVSTQTAPPPPPPPPIISGQVRISDHLKSLATRGDNIMRNWRYVVGSFAVQIPVTNAKVMLPVERNIYSILSWRMSQWPPSNRWIPVMQRYLNYTAGRVSGLGENPITIDPSPWGPCGPPAKSGRHGGGQHGTLHHRDRRYETGKVLSILYDRFGDFEGFYLVTEAGREPYYRSRQPDMGRLARWAWIEGVVVTVAGEGHEPAELVQFVLERNPGRRGNGW